MLRRLLPTLAVAVLSGAFLACATTGGTGGSSGVSLSATEYSAEELARMPHANLYDLLQQHHEVRVGRSTNRTSLSVRHRGDYIPARLLVNDSEAADPITFLQQTRPGEIAFLEIRDPREASTVYGEQGLFAVVAITLK